MTPTEARLIDKQEFEAECEAIRQRAFALVADRHAADRHHRARFPSIYKTSKPQPTAQQRRNGPKAKQYCHAGQSRTLAEWARHFGVSLATFSARVRASGLAAAVEAGSTRVNPHPAPTFEYEGETLTLMQWAAKLGISVNTLRRRIAKGATPQEAIAQGSRVNGVGERA